MSGWQFWIDRGGTFTDVVARLPDGRLVVEKLLSEAPDRYADAAVEAIRRLLGVREGSIPAEAVAAVKMGTTVATNALLERKGEPTLLAITAGHGDALRIGYQSRPKLFARHIVLPEPLYAEVVEVTERVGADGEVLVPLDEARTRADLQAAYSRGLRAVAVVLMHGYRFTEHEQRVAALAREIGFPQVSVSHEVSALMKLVARGDTTVADAYLSPILRRYVDRLADQLGGVRLMFMQSNGGLVEAQRFRGRDAVLSGPAGGIVGMVRTAAEAGIDRVLGFDMGGTSTDVSHYAGEYERSFDTEVAGVRLRAPMMRIHTVAAGGGSICRFEGGRLRVGPQSAGADPGPACYRRGGPLTVTDCNLLLGRLQPETFPKVFGPGGDRPLDLEVVRARFAALADEIAAATGRPQTPEAVAEGFLTIAVDNMAAAIRQISVQRGYDVEGYTLACFGGAAGQHACRVAEALGVRRVMIHPLAGVLSAYGMGLADVRALREATVERRLDAGGAAELEAQADTLAQAARDEVLAQGVDPGLISTLRRVHLKYEGTDTALPVPFGDTAALRAAFHLAHRQRFGFVVADKPVVVEALSAEAVGESQSAPDSTMQATAGAPARAMTAQMWSGGVATPTPVFDRVVLPAGWRRSGPVIVIDASQTAVVEPGWAAEVDASGNLMLTVANIESVSPSVGEDPDLGQSLQVDRYSPPLRSGGGGPRAAWWRGLAGSRGLRKPPSPSFAWSPPPASQGEIRSPSDKAEAIALGPDPVRLELFGNLFMAVAEQMGAALQTTAYSVNIKERLDFSCALFDATGALIANAPHIPVHLGSMGEGVRTVIHARGEGRDGRGMQPGDAYMLNAPYRGGTHLPDVTVIVPVFAGEDDKRAAYFVAARGHHADIGGITPGSMPPQSTSVDQEGVMIDDVLLADADGFKEAEVRALLGSGPWPARNIAQNLGDLKAQLAACVRGSGELQAMVRRHGRAMVDAYMAHVQDNAEAAVREAIARLKEGGFRYEMDNGAVVAVQVGVDQASRSVTVDFTGTSAQLPDNFNAPFSVCRAAVLYVFRTLVDGDMPLNDGCMRPITLIAPEGTLLNPRYPAAVVAGNVETSQVITDCLYGALGVQAAAQGTMNNFTFGDDDRQYYETICGGSGAGPDYDGADAVQTHMTNSRLTDPEVLEHRFPVVLERFAIRRGSGGAGAHHGGDGVSRRVRFTASMTAAILANRRRVPPFGLEGGAPGGVGSARVERADGTVQTLASAQVVQVEAGDAFVIDTPGGGGYGLPKP